MTYLAKVQPSDLRKLAKQKYAIKLAWLAAPLLTQNRTNRRTEMSEGMQS
jgi:hypothetical protein